jgi:hypothetical protein
LKKLEETIDAAAVIWKELDVSCTHKARGLFDGHALERLNGIGDKGEDFVEKGHQIGLRDERRTWNIQNFEKRQRSQIKHARYRNQVAIKRKIVSVQLSSKRNLRITAIKRTFW